MDKYFLVDLVGVYSIYWAKVASRYGLFEINCTAHKLSQELGLIRNGCTAAAASDGRNLLEQGSAHRRSVARFK